MQARAFPAPIFPRTLGTISPALRLALDVGPPISSKPGGLFRSATAPFRRAGMDYLDQVRLTRHILMGPISRTGGARPALPAGGFSPPKRRPPSYLDFRLIWRVGHPAVSGAKTVRRHRRGRGRRRCAAENPDPIRALRSLNVADGGRHGPPGEALRQTRSRQF